MPVAKIYENFKQISEPYFVHGHAYVKIDLNGSEKEIRYYTDQEYSEMYDNEYKSPKIALGFKNGYITIFKGNTKNLTSWFQNNGARYNKIFGWYFISDMALPKVLPEGINPIKLQWTDISNGTALKSETEIVEKINSIIFDKSNSEFKGMVGQKQMFTLTVTKVVPIDTKYGSSNIHNMVDDEGNEFIWTTGSKTLVVGNKYKVTGLVKEHKKYKNIPQTILTRCAVECIEGENVLC